MGGDDIEMTPEEQLQFFAENTDISEDLFKNTDNPKLSAKSVMALHEEFCWSKGPITLASLTDPSNRARFPFETVIKAVYEKMGVNLANYGSLEAVKQAFIDGEITCGEWANIHTGWYGEFDLHTTHYYDEGLHQVNNIIFMVFNREQLDTLGETNKQIILDEFDISLTRSKSVIVKVLDEHYKKVKQRSPDLQIEHTPQDIVDTFNHHVGPALEDYVQHDAQAADVLRRLKESKGSKTIRKNTRTSHSMLAVPVEEALIDLSVVHQN